MMSVPGFTILGREVRLVYITYHKGEEHRRRTVEQIEQTLAYKDLLPVLAWLKAFCPTYSRRWVVMDLNSAEVHALILTMASDDDVFAFKMRWC